MRYKYIGVITSVLACFIVLGVASLFFQNHKANQAPVFLPTKRAEPAHPQAIPVKQSYLGKIREAEELIEKQHFSRASSLLSSSIAEKPELISPYLLLGEIYIRSQENEKLKNLIPSLAENFPGHPSIAVFEARRLIMEKKYQEAVTTFEQNQDVLTPDLTFYYGLLLALQNDHETAQELLNGILEFDIEDEEALKVTSEGIQDPSLETDEETISAELALKTRSIVDVYEGFDTVSDGQTPHLLALISKALSEHQEMHLAKAFAENAIKEDVAYIDAWILRGYASLMLGENDSALKDLEYAYEQSPERTNTLYFLGLAYLETGKVQEATVFFEKLLEEPFEYSDEVRWKLIDLYTEAQNYERVIELYREVLAENNNPKDFVGPLQIAIDVLRQPEVALTFTEDLVQRNPDDYLSFNFHAWALIANKQYLAAEQALDTALELKPENPGSYLYKGLLFEEQNQFTKAIEAYKESYEMGKDGPEIGITKLAAQKHNQLLERKEKPVEPEAPDKSPNSP